MITCPEDQLTDAILATCEITCEKCRKTSFTQGDEHEAAMDFYNDGWRRPHEITYCPECVKKHLKKRKPPQQ